MGLVVCALLMIGCAPKSARLGGKESPDKVIHDLRTENTKLRKQLDSFDRQIKLRLAEISALKQRMGSKPTVVPGVSSEDVSRFVAIELGTFSGAIDTNKDGDDDTVRIYLQTLDQFGRFIPAVGKATINVVHVGSEKTTAITKKVFDPLALRAAYRTGFTGTHYTLKFPLPAIAGNVKELTLKLSFVDAATGVTAEISKLVSLKRQSNRPTTASVEN